MPTESEMYNMPIRIEVNEIQHLVIDRPHEPYGQHIDLLTRIPEIGAQKLRIGTTGEILSEDFLTKGGGRY